MNFQRLSGEIRTYIVEIFFHECGNGLDHYPGVDGRSVMVLDRRVFMSGRAFDGEGGRNAGNLDAVADRTGDQAVFLLLFESLGIFEPTFEGVAVVALQIIDDHV